MADLGGYLTFKKDYGGLMLAKAAVGYSKTLGCRDNFDGTSHEANLLPLAPEWIEAIKQKQTEKATW